MEYAVRPSWLPAGWMLIAQRDLCPRALILEAERLVLVRGTGSRGRDLVRARNALRLAGIL